MVTSRTAAEAAHREARLKRKAGLCCCPCLIQLTEVRQGSGKKKMSKGVISAGLDGPAEPCDRFGVGPAPQLAVTGQTHPPECVAIAGREAKRLLDMGLGLYISTNK